MGFEYSTINHFALNYQINKHFLINFAFFVCFRMTFQNNFTNSRNMSNDIKIRPYEFSDSEHCRELFVQGMLEALPGPIMRAVYPGYLRKAMVFGGLVVMAVAWLSLWVAVIYGIICVVLTALLYIHIYLACHQYIKSCLMSDLVDIDKHYMNKKGSHMWVAEVNGQIVGMVGLLQTENCKLGTGELQRMSVSRLCRGRGIARKLLHEVTQFAREYGHTRIVLSTTSVQTPAIRLYRSTGFKMISSIPHPASPYILCDLTYDSFELVL